MTQQATAPALPRARPALLDPDSGAPDRPRVLSGLRTGDRAMVSGIESGLDAAVRRRLHDLGVSPGTPVTCLRRAPFGGPIVYRIGETELCLRRTLADAVLVTTP